MAILRRISEPETLERIDHALAPTIAIEDALARAVRALEMLRAAVGTKEEGPLLKHAATVLRPQVIRFRQAVEQLDDKLEAMLGTWEMIPDGERGKVVGRVITTPPGTAGACPSASH